MVMFGCLNLVTGEICCEDVGKYKENTPVRAGGSCRSTVA